MEKGEYFELMGVSDFDLRASHTLNITSVGVYFFLFVSV